MESHKISAYFDLSGRKVVTHNSKSDLPLIICIFISIQIAEEDESSRRSSPAAERLRKQVLSKEEISETASIVESEDGVSKIQISGTEDVFKQVIEVKDTDEQTHRKISASMEPVSFDEETGRN